MIVNVIDQQQTLKISEEQVKQLVKEVILSEGETCDEVNVYFVDTPTICDLHEQFFNDPSPTDCISFPLDEKTEGEGDYRLLGEVFVCPETAIDYLTHHSGSVYDETSLYIVHGLLHLMGYDDIEDEDISLMREAEKWHMQNLENLSLLLKKIP